MPAMQQHKASPTSLCKSLWVVACLSPALAAAQWQGQDSPPPAKLPPMWATHNRHLSISATQLQQRYREQDIQSLTTDGTLNTERGSAPGYALQGRWQGDLPLGSRSLPLWLQASATWAQGQTNYDGYLQSGSTLTPYRAKTGNTWRSYSLALGVPIALGQGQAGQAQWQVVPHLQWASTHWQRNLVQYGESYRHTSAGPGLLLQWAASPQWLLEAGAAWRKQSPVQVRVPQLGFEAQQSGGTQRILHLAAAWQPPSHWPAAEHWCIAAQAQHSRWANGASPVVNGLQAPPNQHRQTQYSLGLVWRY